MGEYERGVATYLNAALGPIIARYLDRLQGQDRTQPADGDAILRVSPSPRTKPQGQAVRLLLSGPAGGLIACARAA